MTAYVGRSADAVRESVTYTRPLLDREEGPLVVLTFTRSRGDTKRTRRAGDEGPGGRPEEGPGEWGRLGCPLGLAPSHQHTRSINVHSTLPSDGEPALPCACPGAQMDRSWPSLGDDRGTPLPKASGTSTGLTPRG